MWIQRLDDHQQQLERCRRFDRRWQYGLDELGVCRRQQLGRHFGRPQRHGRRHGRWYRHG